MIKNDLELSISKESLAEFLESLKNLETDSAFMELTPIKKKILRDAICGEIENLKDQIDEYERLTNGEKLTFELINPTDLPVMLIKARINRGLSYVEVGEKLGIDAEKFEEAEEELFVDADPQLLLKLIETLDINVPPIIPELITQSRRQVIANLRKTLGQLLQKVIPFEIIENENIIYGHLKLATSLKRIFGEYANLIISGLKPEYETDTSLRYKVPRGANADAVYLYTSYAYHIAKEVNKIIDVPISDLTTDPFQFREAVIEKYGSFNFKNCINHIWDLGVPIIPLDLKGGFHGACWRFEGRNIIVLKQQSKSESKWLFDLLHEYWHATQQSHLLERDKVDISDVLSIDYEDQEEVDANNFANNVIFDGKGEQLLRQCYSLSQGRQNRLKTAVERVALLNDADVSSLANYVAHNESRRGGNFWGAAHNLQVKDNPYRHTLKVFEERISITDIDDKVEKELLEKELAAI